MRVTYGKKERERERKKGFHHDALAKTANSFFQGNKRQRECS